MIERFTRALCQLGFEYLGLHNDDTTLANIYLLASVSILFSIGHLAVRLLSIRLRVVEETHPNILVSQYVLVSMNL